DNHENRRSQFHGIEDPGVIAMSGEHQEYGTRIQRLNLCAGMHAGFVSAVLHSDTGYLTVRKFEFSLPKATVLADFVLSYEVAGGAVPCGSADGRPQADRGIGKERRCDNEPCDRARGLPLSATGARPEEHAPEVLAAIGEP